MTNRRQQEHQDDSLLGRVFDSYQNMKQIAACIREAARQQSIACPRVLELSRRDTGLRDYLPEASIVRYPTHEDNQPTLGAPVVIPFADRSFDSCLISDVYEHIPAERRPELLGEMLRVTSGLVLVAAPQENEIVTRFDRIVFDFIWGKYAEKFEPLAQHVGFGLEPLEKIIASLKAKGADQMVVLPANYVYRWIHMILIYFDLQHRNSHAELFEPLNRVYNSHLAPYDYSEPCYRYLIAIATSNRLDVNQLKSALIPPYTKPELADETDRMLVQAFREIDSTAADRLRECVREIERLKASNLRLRRRLRLFGRTRRKIRLWLTAKR